MLLCSLKSHIYWTSAHARTKDPSSVALSEGSYEFFLTRFEGLKAEDVPSVQFVKAQRDNMSIVISGYTNRIGFDLMLAQPCGIQGPGVR